MGENINTRMVEELKTCGSKILSELDVQRKLFLLKVASEIVGSSLIYNDDDDLIVSNFVLDVAHAFLSTKLEEGDAIQSLYPDLSVMLDDIGRNIIELANAIENNLPKHEINKNIIKSIYALTDFGLYKKIKKQE